MNAPPGERVAWLADKIDVHGRVLFDTLVDAIEQKYPQHSRSKCRELAWEWGAVRAPSREDYPPEDVYGDADDTMLADVLKSDDEIQRQAKDRGKPGLLMYPRRHENGAWFCLVSKRSDAAAKNHQEPTERGDVTVYIGESGAWHCAHNFGILDVDDDEFLELLIEYTELGVPMAAESDGSGESDEVSSEDFDDVDIDGATDESSPGKTEEDDDEAFEELEGADRGRE